MNNTIRIALVAVVIVIAQDAFAHDHAEHAREAAETKKGANCAAMKDMDASKMNSNDPVMKAMMLKCGNHTDANTTHSGHTHTHAAAMHAAQPDAHEAH